MDVAVVVAVAAGVVGEVAAGAVDPVVALVVGEAVVAGVAAGAEDSAEGDHLAVMVETAATAEAVGEDHTAEVAVADMEVVEHMEGVHQDMVAALGVVEEDMAAVADLVARVAAMAAVVAVVEADTATHLHNPMAAHLLAATYNIFEL